MRVRRRRSLRPPWGGQLAGAQSARERVGVLRTQATCPVLIPHPVWYLFRRPRDKTIQKNRQRIVVEREMSRSISVARPFLPIITALLLLGLLSCTAGTDTELPEPASDTAITDTGDDAITDPGTDTTDQGGEDPAIDVTEEADQPVEDTTDATDAADAPSLEPRCNGRAIETYDEGEEEWAEDSVCERTERCIDGVCEDLPDGFGEACDDGACASDELSCIDDLCISHEAGDAGTECWGDEECLEDLLCAQRGFCQEGAAGDLCLDDDDCAADLAPYCGPDGACQLGAEGDACADDLHCDDPLYCADAILECRDGSVGDNCDSTGDCEAVDSICAGDPTLCRARIEGDGCTIDNACTGDLYCANDICQDGSNGDFCDGTSDCGPADNVCKGDPATCQVRIEGEICADDPECPIGLYCANLLCQDGSSGDFCDTTADCAVLDEICKGAPAICQDRIKDDACVSDDAECPGDLYCANLVCQDGTTGDYCDVTVDCDEVNDICNGAPAECVDRIIGDGCGTDDAECPGDLYCANAMCQDGTTGNYCDTTDACDEVNDICAGDPGACIDRIIGDLCAGNDECPGELYCANDMCQDGTTGHFCNSTDDCDEADDVCKGDTPSCQDRIEGEVCAGDTECPAGLYCASSAGECRDGSSGDECDATADCDDLDHQCVGDPMVCTVRELGDDCGVDDDCPDELHCSNDHCSPEGFAWIEDGSFWMGSPDGDCPGDYPGDCSVAEVGRHEQEVLHHVTITQEFFLAETELTQQQWREVAEWWNALPSDERDGISMDIAPSYFSSCGDSCPAERLSWWDAIFWLNARSLQKGLDTCYELSGCTGTPGGGCESSRTACGGDFLCDEVSTTSWNCSGYRLPTESEWEYAARAGTTTAFYDGDITYEEWAPLDPKLDLIGWYGGNSSGTTGSDVDCSTWYADATFCGPHPVASKDPNAWGLYDTSGNVLEYVWDWHVDYPTWHVIDPLGPQDGQYRVQRGGGWNSLTAGCRAADRRRGDAHDRRNTYGFRPARTFWPEHCLDDGLSGDESDVDCGGSCAPCGLDADCELGSDCFSGHCTELVCTEFAGHCYNEGLDLDDGETDVDCGGECGGCANDDDCLVEADCLSGFCTELLCTELAPHCYNETLDDGDGETDVDCGGSCAPCELGNACGEGDDCDSGHCSRAGLCAVEVTVDGSSMTFMHIPAGTFWMGSPDGSCPDGYPGDCTSEPYRSSDEELHEVTLTHPFFAMETEVTQAHWAAVMATRSGGADLTPAYFGQCGVDCPIEAVNWWEAAEYLNVLSELEGLEPCYTLVDCDDDLPGDTMDCGEVMVTAPEGDQYLCEGYRLPTEAEFERAYRAGTTTAFYNGGISTHSYGFDPNLDAIGWYGGNSGVSYEGGYDCSKFEVEGQDFCSTHPVASKEPNPLGLYDMPGNISEWVFDSWNGDPYSADAIENPVNTHPDPDDDRTYRGGGALFGAAKLRAAVRGSIRPGQVNWHFGFRAYRTAWPEHCLDDGLSGDESDVDCGGSCAPCGLDADCELGSDCFSGHCTELVCTEFAGHCYNEGLDLDDGETDVDCGGECGGCANDDDCLVEADCLSGFCTELLCTELAPHCYNETLDDGDGETDVDCGGSCAPCELGNACGEGDDCDSGHCSRAGLCAVEVTVDGSSMTFMHIPAGTFWMGSPDGSCPDGYPGDCTSEPYRSSDEELHEVTLTHPFFAMETEVTQAHWAAVMATRSGGADLTPAYFGQCGVDCPIEAVNWWEAAEYLNVLSELEGLEPCYTLVDCDDDLPGDTMDCGEVMVTAPEGDQYLCEGYRLPTEAEFERAYRAGTTTAFYNGGISTHSYGFDPNLDAIGWYGGNSGVSYEGGYDCSKFEVEGQDFCSTHPVASKEPNPLGLYDMPGNISEWVFDSWNGDPYSADAIENPVNTHPDPDDDRTYRGGGALFGAAKLRAAVRGSIRPGQVNWHFGFRAYRTAWPEHCLDDGLSGDESDVDCGGSCAPCALGAACGDGDDCDSGHCGHAGFCAVEVTVDTESMSFMYIEAGTFWMGSPTTECPGGYPGECTLESGRQINEDLHEVTLTRPFLLQETEVTQGQWTATGFSNPSRFDMCGLDCPVEKVNWWEAIAYVNALSVSEGLEPCYTLEGDCDPSLAGSDIDCADITVSDPGASDDPYLCEGYRLPTEAEWEYAYRAGTNTAFYNGGISETLYSPLDENLNLIGWYGGNSGVTYASEYDCTGWYDGADACGTHQVGGKAPNNQGLYDMSGNVLEWVWDMYDTYPAGPVVDPVGGNDPSRVRRGGAWTEIARNCRAATRTSTSPGSPNLHAGFRVARTAWPDHCLDDALSGDESDVDCGGGCVPCALAAACEAGSDCHSGHCSRAGLCAVEVTFDTESMTFMYIDEGSFWMGSPDGDCPGEYPGDCVDELGRRSEETLHEATLTRGFFLQETEVTQRQWLGFFDTNPSTFDQCGLNCPVEEVNWWEAVAYVNALSEWEDLTPCYTLEGCDPSSAGTTIQCTGITVSDPDASGNPYLCEGYRLPFCSITQGLSGWKHGKLLRSPTPQIQPHGHPVNRHVGHLLLDVHQVKHATLVLRLIEQRQFHTFGPLRLKPKRADAKAA